MKNKIRTVIMVGSCKGGVGKSLITSLVALELYSRKKATETVGILDTDISGPSIPKILGIKSSLTATDKGIQPTLTVDGMPALSIELFMNQKSTCVLWDDIKKKDFITTILNDVDWNLDYLCIDSPPTTGTEPQVIIEYTQENNIKAGMLLVSSPQDIALNDVSKAISMARRLGMPILGIIENFASFKCSCGKEHYLFGKGKVEQFCKDNDIKYLGAIPLIPELSEVSDKCLSIATIPKEIKPIISKLVDDILKELNK